MAVENVPAAQAASENNSDRPNKRVIERLVMCAKGGCTEEDLASIVQVDPILCYALFAELGATGAVPTSYVTTCKQAIETMGMAAFNDWVLAAQEHAVVFDRFSDRVRNTLIRARFMELVGQSAMARENTEALYIVGLFSRLHRLLNIPLAELILPLPISEEMRAAILEQSGRVGRLLKFAQTIENADEPGIDFMQTNMRLPAVQVYDAYNEAYDWMGEVEAKYTSIGG